MRRLGALLLLACAAAQPALGSPLLAGALRAGIGASDHSHSVELRSDGHHVDIVLSHGESSVHDHPAPCGPDHPADLTEADHVLHATAGDAANATSRRVLQTHAPALAVSAALPLAPARPSAPVRSTNAHARSPDHLRTVVLRL